MSKGAVHRLAGIVAVELGERGIVGFNLHPGFVTTERILIDMAPFGFDGSTGAPPDVIGAATAWLVTEPEARALNGTWIEGQELCAEHDLLPGWPVAREV
jgi:NAD(P)-dependent dehydrogenase (short-subunit alcohol dehydrogenase family)